MVIVNLAAGAFQISVVIQQFQPPQKLLLAAAQKRHNLRRTEKTMPVNEADDLTVTPGELHGCNRGSAFEARKAGCHPATVPETGKTKET